VTVQSASNAGNGSHFHIVQEMYDLWLVYIVHV